MSNEISRQQALFEGMRDILINNPDRIKDLNVSYGFDFTKDESGKWFFKIANGAVEIGEGELDDLDCVISTKFSDYLDISTGKLNSTMAFMMGKLKFNDKKNVIGLLTKLFAA